jgi:UDPglucose 6-dehydrogenase
MTPCRVLSQCSLFKLNLVKLKLTIIGLGYLGATTAVAFAKLGHEVIGIDPDTSKIELLKQGKLPFYEPGLDNALVEVVEAGNITFSTEHSSTSSSADIHMICVGTPQGPDGSSADTKYLYSALDSLIPFLEEDAVIVGKSTVPVGTAAQIRNYLEAKLSFTPHIAWNPEFLREGTALKDTLEPDRIVIGVEDSWSEKLLRLLYEDITEAGVPLITCDIPTSELVKVAANSFLATKISFINAIAEVAEVAGADTVKLAEAIGYDERIGNKFLRNGIGFGGGCLPKDIRAFMARANELGVGHAVAFLSEVEAINLRRRARVLEIAQEELGDLTSRRVAILGAAFKPETDDIRDSPAIAVAEQFWMAGAHVVIHDPKALNNVRRAFPQIETQPTVELALSNADLVVVATEWNEYREANPAELAKLVANRLVIDGRNTLDANLWQQSSWQIIALGRNLERIPVLV